MKEETIIKLEIKKRPTHNKVFAKEVLEFIGLWK